MGFLEHIYECSILQELVARRASERNKEIKYDKHLVLSQISVDIASLSCRFEQVSR